MGEGESLGVTVEDFRTRTCNNACLFCFIDQLPPGVRPTLKVKDDDYRLSFLHGNYVTLTNLPERELDRIVAQALSPSVRLCSRDRSRAAHADAGPQEAGRPGPEDPQAHLRRHPAAHPDRADAGHQRRPATSRKRSAACAGITPGVASVAIVPLGLSDHGTDPGALPRRYRRVLPRGHRPRPALAGGVPPHDRTDIRLPRGRVLHPGRGRAARGPGTTTISPRSKTASAWSGGSSTTSQPNSGAGARLCPD